ncbi:hypothetical protein Psi02_41800 [Planotetraspora silvatica]|uniref:Hsp70 family protein n=1 Tax=Planotetraspora silvatica TaxID=234614 RepID=A0A8J3UNQ6_9ACTN|nr:Hsp70 family protein [Planotetraspora silvatica]GII47756.1 hypothetical protein Psi02_41800 [Planotetraspora silvatica]
MLVAGRVAQRSMARYPERVERNPKRYVGKKTMLLGGVPVDVGDALAALLGLFVSEGRVRFNGSMPSCVVLTCPVAWRDDRRDVLRAAGEAVVPDARIVLVEEPVAAALHYASTHRVNGGKRVAVYDLGGGTFDAAVLAADGDDFKVIGEPGGDDAIGGEVFDEQVYGFFGEQLERTRPEFFADVTGNPDRRFLAAAADLLEEARIAKETLSAYGTASQYIAGADVDVTITKDDLDGLVKADVTRTADLLDETLERAKVTAADLAGIFLTGGASRMPLVHATLRERHGELVHTSDDPKIVVALGAARLAWKLKSDNENHIVPVMEGVIDVAASAAGVYALCAGEAGRHVLRRIDVAAGQADRELQFGEVVDWAVSGEGVVVADRAPDGVRLRTLTPELTIRSGQLLPPGSEPRVLARDAAGWAFFQPRRPTLVNNAIGLPWGETGSLSVIEVSLGGFFAQEAPPVPLGNTAQWFVNEDNSQRRLLDQDSPTGGGAALAVGSSGCVVVLGQFKSKKGVFGGAHQNFVPWQVLCLVEPGGKISRIERRSPNWLQQVVLHDGKWFISTNAGLEIDASPAPPQVIVPRQRAGALRWFPAGTEMYAVGMDTVVPARGWSVLHYDAESGSARVLAQNDRECLLGHLTSRAPLERPRVISDGDSLWMAVSGEGGTSRILHVTPSGATEVFRAPGWVEPVAKVPYGLLCLHLPDTPPGVSRPFVTRLVRIAV